MTSQAAVPIVNALTVDVEDYFQVSAFQSLIDVTQWDRLERRVVGNTIRLLDLFAHFEVRATFFVLGWIAEREPQLIRRIAEAGHEVASHGYWHRLVYEESAQKFREDVRASKSLLQGLTGRPVLGYRAPSFSITIDSLWALDILAEEGYVYDASVFPVRHHRYGIPAAPRHPYRFGGRGLVEVPASTVRVGGVNLPVAGGGYFRLLPYRWTRWGITQVNERELRPVVFYVHPWELDPGQPRLGVSFLTKVRHYRNLSNVEARLRRLLSEFKFASVASVFLADAAFTPTA